MVRGFKSHLRTNLIDVLWGLFPVFDGTIELCKDLLLYIFFIITVKRVWILRIFAWARRLLGYCPGLEAAARFTPERKIDKRFGLFVLTSFTLIIVITIAYSGYTTIQTNQAREEYARALFSDFTIIEVKEKDRSAFYWDGFRVSPIHFYDVKEFINVAHQQEVEVLYRVIPGVGRHLYYYFESPIYFENYRVYEREITPPVIRDWFDRPEINLNRTG